MLLTLLLVLLAVCSSQSKPFTNDSSVPRLSPSPNSIVKPLNIQSSDSADQVEPGMKIWRFDIGAEGCGSARFNLNPFDMAQGDYIVVYGIDANGQHVGVQRHEGRGWLQEGEVNTRRFWAKEAVLEVYLRSPKSHFRLNYIHYAECFQERPGMPQAVCGRIDWRNIICYQNVDPEIFSLGPSVFQLEFVDNGHTYDCTAWKVSTDGRFLTAKHCIGTVAVLRTAVLSYRYDSTQCATDIRPTRTTYHGNDLIKVGATFDYSIFTVRENTGHVTCLGRTNFPPDPKTGVMFIIHHPHGLVKKVSFESDVDIDGVCRRAATCHKVDSYCYMCDTENGSSGAPVFYYVANQPRMRVFALHGGGHCPNDGLQMSLLSSAAGIHLGTCA